MIDIFTDASCIPPAGVGGWAALIRYEPTRVVELSGMEPCGRINRMELLAAIKALATIPVCTEATIWTDSQYVVRGSGQFKKYIKQGDVWVKKGYENSDLWRIFDELKRTRTISVRWIRGHSGHPDNEFVNKLARTTVIKALRARRG